MESAAVFRVWSKAPCSDAKEKPCCRSDNTSLPQQVHHQGHQIIHVAIHQAGCWLIGGHSTVAQEFNKCVTCKKSKGPVIKQCMADLPVRTEVAPLFTNVGFNILRRDVEVQPTPNTGTGNHLPKECIDASSFISTLRRFFAPIGPVSILWYDWGTNFIGRRMELGDAVAREEED